MENFGDYLKVHREKKGIRLEEIASITKIHFRSLELLEASNWTELPPEPFIRGFIIAYAKYVGMDTKEVLERYFAETGQHAATSASTAVAAEPLPHPPSQLASDVIEQGRPLPTGPVFAGIGAVVVIGLITTIVYIGKRSVNADAAKAPTAAAAPAAPKDDARAVASPNGDTTAKPEGTTDATATTAPAPPPPDFAHEVVIEAKDRTWARVIIDDEPPQKFFVREGEKVSYRAKEKLKIVLGNGTSARVMHNGKPVLGFKAGDTLRAFRFPKDAKFPQDNAARRAAAARDEADKSEGGGESATPAQESAVVNSPGE